ncbi:MAG: glycosyltransferase family 2 protein [Bosea sp.]|uniref:glycosyltransferase family 2 protein n=1 Tax=unclassified Bosea (in: a-proteobacteria) TaxID=2653178 RepID=UPI00096686ED|nr:MULTISPECIES: glycosyltransferase family 2 protein [unclassified Bosea (in: a-proteobacteria)]MBN9456305.1 glycosyltransferase family 2 protein [Bosea sp. (in: a-proteobacteria)]OJV05396.1 MAG: glycosyl transferase [Bosea sp. 67-29]
MPANAITAIVVSHDSAEVLPACLAALAGEGVPTIVVDNASGDDSRVVAAQRGARVIANARNEGYGRGNNIGIAAAATPYVLVVNPDLELRPGAAAALLEAAGRYPDAGMLAPRIVEPSGRLFLQPRSLLSPSHLNRSRTMAAPEGDACLPFLSGACLLIRRELFLALGGFDPAIFLFYEDDDLCRRMRDAGQALVHVHEAEAGHGRGRSSTPSPQRRFKTRWHLAWSERYVARKYGLPQPSPVRTLENLAKALGYGLILRREKMFAHAGSAAGALAWGRGETALAREGLTALP